MGCVIYFVLSNGKHPFGDRYDEAHDCIKKNEYKLEDPDIRKWTAAKDLIESMIKAERSQRYIIVFFKSSTHLFWQDFMHNYELLILAMHYFLFMDRPSATAVLSHCFFWDMDKDHKFFEQVSNFIGSKEEHKNALEGIDAFSVIGVSWMEKLQQRGLSCSFNTHAIVDYTH